MNVPARNPSATKTPNEDAIKRRPKNESGAVPAM
jgi:hypothetical protein